jgi:hypothetical protein
MEPYTSTTSHRRLSTLVVNATTDGTTGPMCDEFCRRYYTYVSVTNTAIQTYDIEVVLPKEIEWTILLLIKKTEFCLEYIFNAYLSRAPPNKNFKYN